MKTHVGSRLVHSPEELRRFIADDLRQPTLAAEVQVAAARIAERCHGARGRLADSPSADQWSYALAGEVAIFGILMAAVRSASAAGATKPLRRAEEWARMQFDRRLADALEPTPAEAVLLDTADAEAYVADYAAAIGDVEQTMAGEQHRRDPLLDRNPASASTAAEPLAPAAAPDEAHGPLSPAASNGSDEGDAGATGEIAAWLTEWIAEAMQRDRAEIRMSDRFSEFGMDSVKAVMLINSFEELWGVALPRTAVWDYPTIGELTRYLATLVAAPAAAPAAAAKPNGAPIGPDGSRGAAKAEPLPDDIAVLAQIDRLSPEEIKSLLSQFPHAE
jgi:acyl carrier protein